MAIKKNIKKNDIISWFMDHILNQNKYPNSVYSFAKQNNFEEAKFYEYFGTFEAVEKEIFKVFYDNTISLLNKSENFDDFDARNKLLSFYYTFFEILTANRSYVLHVLNGHKNKLKSLNYLNELKKSFSEYIENLDIQTIDFKEDKLEKIKQRSIKESAWFQLLVTMKFWIDDTSSSF